MKKLESIYHELENLFIHNLSDCIEKINKEHNDGIIIKQFSNTTLSGTCIKTPSFIFNIEESELSEKDRIIENTVYKIIIEINLPPNPENKLILLCRYYEAIELSINNNEGLQKCRISGSKENKVFIKIKM